MVELNQRLLYIHFQYLERKLCLPVGLDQAPLSIQLPLRYHIIFNALRLVLSRHNFGPVGNEFQAPLQ